jgi:hypothetical protein
VRHIQYVIVVSVSYENEVCLLNVRVDCRNVRRRNVGPLVGPTRVSRHGVPDPPPGVAGPLIRDKYGSTRIVVVPLVISHPAVPRYFRTTSLGFTAFSWFPAAEATSAAFVNAKQVRQVFMAEILRNELVGSLVEGMNGFNWMLWSARKFRSRYRVIIPRMVGHPEPGRLMAADYPRA